ncbi:kinesin-like protein KIN-4A [Brassica napus]|uniref:kinesin-like protein KIN-4A n=1 Tax=Brassica napus TaxID=3708 RepID=UPI002078E468|nr:kinesin-like protein KIN-4A [Brassica napus]
MSSVRFKMRESAKMVLMFLTKTVNLHINKACISTADINAEETLNTLKYAIRARNIRNKPVVNRDHVSSEMLKMRQQLEYLQAELPLRDGGSSCANSRMKSSVSSNLMG